MYRANLSRTLIAHRIARSGASSCGSGAPKMTMAASPMNLSKVPRSSKATSVTVLKKRLSVLWRARRTERLTERGRSDYVAEEDGSGGRFGAEQVRIALQNEIHHLGRMEASKILTNDGASNGCGANPFGKLPSLHGQRGLMPHGGKEIQIFRLVSTCDGKGIEIEHAEDYACLPIWGPP